MYESHAGTLSAAILEGHITGKLGILCHSGLAAEVTAPRDNQSPRIPAHTLTLNLR